MDGRGRATTKGRGLDRWARGRRCGREREKREKRENEGQRRNMLCVKEEK